MGTHHGSEGARETAARPSLVIWLGVMSRLNPKFNCDKRTQGAASNHVPAAMAGPAAALRRVRNAEQHGGGGHECCVDHTTRAGSGSEHHLTKACLHRRAKAALQVLYLTFQVRVCLRRHRTSHQALNKKAGRIQPYAASFVLPCHYQASAGGRCPPSWVHVYP